MLTHFWPGNDRAASVAAARPAFGRDVLAAEEGLTVEIGEGVTAKDVPSGDAGPG